MPLVNHADDKWYTLHSHAVHSSPEMTHRKTNSRKRKKVKGQDKAWNGRCEKAIKKAGIVGYQHWMPHANPSGIV